MLKMLNLPELDLENYSSKQFSWPMDPRGGARNFSSPGL
jgi:hypothetical protein